MASNQSSSSSSSPHNILHDSNSNNNSTPSPLILYAFAFITVSLSSGLVYGYPHLRTNLIANGSILSESQLGIVYTVGSWTVQGGGFFAGLARDSFGTKWVAFLSLLCAALGCIGLAFANENHVASLSISFFLVGLGSGGQLCLQPVASLFDERWQGTVLASLSGAFQISGLMFLVLQKITLDRRFSYAFLALSLCSLALLCVYLLPRNQFVSMSYDHCDENEEDSNDQQKLNTSSYDNIYDGNNECSTHQDDTVAIVKSSVHQNCKNEDADMNETKSLQQQKDETMQNNDTSNRKQQKKKDSNTSAMPLMKSKEYTTLIIWFSILLIPMQYYIGTIAVQLERKGDEDGRYLNIFSICYACAAIMAPVMGKIADLVGLGITQLLATILVASSFFILNHDMVMLDDANHKVNDGGGSNIDNNAVTVWTVQVIGLVCYGIGRMGVFGMYFTNIGKRFGYRHYGTLSGFGLFSSAILSLLQYPLIYLTDLQHENNINLISGVVILVVCVPYCLWLARREMYM